jgi:hypothetical protein
MIRQCFLGSWLMKKPPLYLVCVIISVIDLNCEDYNIHIQR